ncbi:hypothetical protein [Fimbriiglobus ruber]|uniref:Uncharacterized protein n=1 Tax=Fimbriiglobus ruber TaxID=1908690 RepID=A0A225D1U4_9BACT|nr:hypothetical protein [Fimbriiglobus ruber]OWK35551.1 hypothetical protein FRUB_08114 [Fimbriiglobus ruber]
MATRRNTISIRSDEVEILKQLYLEFRFPSDQYRRRHRELLRFTEAWNGLTNRSDSSGELLHFIITQRKQKKWPTFGGTHHKLASMPDDFLSPREWVILREIYDEMLIPLEMGSDNLAYDDLLAQQLSREFRDRAGRTVYGRLLFCAIMTRRKRGEWSTLPQSREANPNEPRMRPFGDIDSIAS